MGRIGKIARLPHAVRTALNLRLQGGHTTRAVLPWLNSLPAVQQVLAVQFNARPVTAENLAAWRKHGFVKWNRQNDASPALKDLARRVSTLENQARLEQKTK
jgi:uncharacterized protein YecE (DUF72 family)